MTGCVAWVVVMNDTKAKAGMDKADATAGRQRAIARAAESSAGWDDATEGEAEGSVPDFKPLTAEEADQWRARQTPVSPWHVVGVQSLAGVLASLVAWVGGGSAAHGWSAAWGALAVVVPAALFARGLSRGVRSGQPGQSGQALMRLMFWEAVKVLVTLAMLLVAPRVVPSLSWMALVASFVVTMKMYWLAWWLHARRRAGRP